MKKFEDLMAIIFMVGKTVVVAAILLFLAPGHMFETLLTYVCSFILAIDFALIVWILVYPTLIKKGIIKECQPEDIH